MLRGVSQQQSKLPLVVAQQDGTKIAVVANGWMHNE